MLKIVLLTQLLGDEILPLDEKTYRVRREKKRSGEFKTKKPSEEGFDDWLFSHTNE
ncbi:hypothetical protein [Vibrio sp. TRT 29B02]|uniref:hypothetical protein n=1 Tax=Vibrio sp. TRT 29B02 TaxID=3418508 RepID=UPI003CE8DC10